MKSCIIFIVFYYFSLIISRIACFTEAHSLNLFRTLPREMLYASFPSPLPKLQNLPFVLGNIHRKRKNWSSALLRLNPDRHDLKNSSILYVSICAQLNLIIAFEFQKGKKIQILTKHIFVIANPVYSNSMWSALVYTI